MEQLRDHPDIEYIMRTGYPRGSEPDVFRCEVCEDELYEEEIYEDELHECICKYCLLRQHKREL